MLLSDTDAPPVGAAFVSVTVHELVAFDPKLVGLHTSELIKTGVTKLMVAGLELPLYVAVTVAIRLLLNAPVVALKLAVVDPAATVTDAGTVSAAWLLLSDTDAPPVGAAFDNVTAQELVALDPRLVGLHTSELTNTGATRLIVAGAELPLYVAVTVAARLVLNVPVVALKLAVVDPAATVTDAGTVNAA